MGKTKLANFAMWICQWIGELYSRAPHAGVHNYKDYYKFVGKITSWMNYV